MDLEDEDGVGRDGASEAQTTARTMDIKMSPSKRGAKTHKDLGGEDGVGGSNVRQEKCRNLEDKDVRKSPNHFNAR